MAVFLALLLVSLALGVWSIAGSLVKIVAQNAKFLPPEPDSGERVEAGDTVYVRLPSFGSLGCRVTGVARDADGALVVACEPAEPEAL